MDKKQNALIDNRELSALLNVCRTTLYHWRKKGLIPFYKIGGSVKYDRHEVIEFIKNSNLAN